MGKDETGSGSTSQAMPSLHNDKSNVDSNATGDGAGDRGSSSSRHFGVNVMAISSGKDSLPLPSAPLGSPLSITTEASPMSITTQTSPSLINTQTSPSSIITQTSPSAIITQASPALALVPLVEKHVKIAMPCYSCQNNELDMSHGSSTSLRGILKKGHPVESHGNSVGSMTLSEMMAFEKARKLSLDNINYYTECAAHHHKKGSPCKADRPEDNDPKHDGKDAPAASSDSAISIGNVISTDNNTATDNSNIADNSNDSDDEDSKTKMQNRTNEWLNKKNRPIRRNYIGEYYDNPYDYHDYE